MDDEIKHDWLVCRLWGKAIEKIEICLLTTRGFMLARHVRAHIKNNLQAKARKDHKPIAGLRRYRTRKRANDKAQQLNRKFSTDGYNSIREDEI